MIKLPRPPSAGSINGLIWARDSTAIYFALGAGNLYGLTSSYGLWRLDITTGMAAQVSDVDVRAYNWADSISPNGQTIVLRSPAGGAQLVNVATGKTTPIALPQAAIVVGWR